MKELSDTCARLENPADLRNRILFALNRYHSHTRLYLTNTTQSANASAVLFLLSPECDDQPEPCLILNKRSAKVKQPGDLCCPGGGISHRRDTFLAKILLLPSTPLTRWPYSFNWRRQRSEEFLTMARFFAGALRESYEEMRLNPFRVMFLGPLPSQRLAMFQREIFPMVCWLPRQKRFSLNWEVEKLIYIPLRKLLNPANYTCYRLSSDTPRKAWNHEKVRDFPSFLPDDHHESDVLWGATFRITMAFLDLVFGFRHPNLESLPVVHGKLHKNYLAGGK